MFRTRNSYYLRISKDHVLPTYVYLDEHHVQWMSSTTLNSVLSDLRPMILPKLKAEADALVGASSAKKVTVDVHRGGNCVFFPVHGAGLKKHADKYQFCYFIRQIEPHSVLLKRRTFTAVPPAVKRPTASRSSKKRKAPPKPSAESKKRKIKKGKSVQDSDELISLSSDSDSEYAPARAAQVEDVVEGRESLRSQTPMDVDLDIEEEEVKPKPIMGLSYQGFNIHGHCLCIVVEPWPALPKSNATSGSLFVTEPEERNELAVPKKLPLFNDPLLSMLDDSDEESAGGGMMELSQVLAQASGEFVAGGVEEEEDQNGGIEFFGDADEIQEL